jgi:heptosyltransferase II
MGVADPERVRKILVREVNWVGDAVLTLPALAALDRRFPRAEIAVLAKPWVAGLFAGQPAVDRIVEYHAEGSHRGLLGRWALARELGQERFDLALLFPNSLDAAIAPWLARVSHRVGYRTDGRGLLLTQGVVRSSRSSERHQVFRYLELVRALGADGEALPQLVVGPEAVHGADRLLGDHGVEGGEAGIAVNPGSIYGSAKRWPAERFAAVADALAERYRARILLIGSAKERDILEAVAGRMRRTPILLGGRTDLGTLAGVLKRVRLLLSNDTGAMHLAAAVGVPVLAVFGPTDADATGPLGPNSRVVRRPVPCSPCLLRECPIDHRCMVGIEIAQVLKAAEELLAITRWTEDGGQPRSAAEVAVGESPERLLDSPAAFLDRDGTIIEDLGYLGDPEQIHFIPGAIAAMRALRAAGYRLVLVTNQAGVARGLISEEDVRRVNDRLRQLLEEAGVPLDAIYYCPHHAEIGPPEYRMVCDCRKPGPGMVERARRDLGVNPARSVIVGDHGSDAGVARHFPGMRAIMVLTGHGAGQYEKVEKGELPMPDHVAADLASAVAWLLARGDR